MQVLCKSADGVAEAHCCVCGQGFVVFWERETRTERAQGLSEIQRTLLNHHRSRKGPEIHPTGGFHVPARNYSAAISGVAILGHAPTWAL